MKKDMDTQFLCKDCERYNLCKYYHNRKEDSYICKYFHLLDKLDKIRAEIESITPKAHIRTGKLSIDTELMIPLDRVLQVIDKNKVESEEV